MRFAPAMTAIGKKIAFLRKYNMTLDEELSRRHLYDGSELSGARIYAEHVDF